MEETAAQSRVDGCTTSAEIPTGSLQYQSDTAAVNGTGDGVIPQDPVSGFQPCAADSRVDGSASAVENPIESSQYQPDSAVNGTGDCGILHDPASGSQPCAKWRRTVTPSIQTYNVQCSSCFKWRLIPNRERYQDIREHILERPFLCKSGREWRPNLSCADPPDIVQDTSRVWAMDQPGIPQTTSWLAKVFEI